MDRDLIVVFDHLKFRVLQAKPMAAQPWLSENDHTLAGRDHLLDIVKVEPAQDQWLTKRVRIPLLDCRLEDFFPTAKPDQPCLDYLAAKEDWHIAFLVGKWGEFASVFVSPRVMGQQVLDGLDLEPAQ